MNSGNDILIRLTDVRKVFRKGATEIAAVAGVSLTIARGASLAIMGHSGCGKSTLLQLIGALEVPTTGTICFDGTDLARMSDRALSRFRNHNIGFVFQNYSLLPDLTVLDNVALPLYYTGVGKVERRRRAAEALDRIGLAERAIHYPSELSGGQEQRVAIARAVVGQPAIVLADEPTGNLDTQTRDQILALFGALNAQGTTILVVTHDPIVAQKASTVLHMQDGRLLGSALDEHP